MFKIKYLIVWVILLFFSLQNVFAITARIVIENKSVDIGDFVKLRLELESNKWWEIKIWEIKWLDKFELVWQAQSQSSSVNTIIVNWETKAETKTVHYLDLTLKPKEKWEFILWPAKIIDWTEQLQTNEVKINITWDKLFINNNHLPVWNNQNNKKTYENKDIDISKDDEDDFENDIIKKDFTSNSDMLYILLWLVAIFWLIIYFILKNNKGLLEEFRENSLKKIKKNNEYINKNSETKNNEYINKNHNHNNDIIDFEKESKKNIIFPDINDDDFINKIDEILKQKLYIKYKIKDIKNKTYENIINNIEISSQDRDELNKIIKQLNELKYSNIIISKSLLLELIKNYK